VRYMAFVKDKINPNKAYVDTTSFTEKWKKKTEKKHAIPRKACFNIYLYFWKKGSWLQTLFDAHLETIHKMKIIDTDAQW
jgi:hypothetical protein